MSFDVALGLTNATVNRALAQLYAKPDARNKFFKGSKTVGPVTINYDIQEPPTVSLDGPPADGWDKWKDAIDNNGVTDDKPVPAAADNPFQVRFTQFEVSSGSDTGTAPLVIVFCTSSLAGTKVTFDPQKAWLDESKVPGWTKIILNAAIGVALQKAEQQLAGLDIPPLSFGTAGVTVDLGDPVATIGGGRLLLLANLKSKKDPPDPAGFTWPQQDLFGLLSTDVMNQVAGGAAAKFHKTDTGDGDKGIAKYTYTYTASVSGAQVNPAKLTEIDATLNINFSGDVTTLDICPMERALKGLGGGN